jgi:dihydrofolate reductase
MSRLVVSEFMTLDGVMEAPGFEEHRDGKNAWALQAAADDQQRFKVDELFTAGAILLGRVTYQIWAAFWPDAPREEGFADRINSLEKYVVSTTLREPTWNNTKVIRGDLSGEVSRLKERSDGDVLVFGSAELVDRCWSSTWWMSCGSWSSRWCSGAGSGCSARSRTSPISGSSVRERSTPGSCC